MTNHIEELMKAAGVEKMPDEKNNFVKDINVPSKEQIIIDGVDIFNTIDEWADLISQEWCSGEYPTAEIIKNYILDINKQLARKTAECEELKKANIHIDNNRKCKAKKLKEIEQLLIDCSSGYTDEVMQKIMEIIHKPETVCFENKYEQALDDIEKELKEDINCESQECGCNDFKECLKCTKEHILDIISKAKGEE